MHAPELRSARGRAAAALAALAFAVTVACTTTTGAPGTPDRSRTTASTSVTGAVGVETPASLAAALEWVPVPPAGRTAVQYTDLVGARAMWPALPWVPAGSDADIQSFDLDAQTMIKQTTAVPGDPVFPLGEDVRPGAASPLGTEQVPQIGTVPARTIPGSSDGGTSTPSRSEPVRPAYRLNDVSRAAYGFIPSDVDAELVVQDEGPTSSRRVRALFGHFDPDAIQAALSSPDLRIDAKDEGGIRTLAVTCTAPTSETRKDGTKCREQHIVGSTVAVSPTMLVIAYLPVSKDLWDQMRAAHADPAKSIASQPAVADVAAALDRHHTYFSALRWGPVGTAPTAPAGGTRAPTDFQSLGLDRDGVASAVGTTRLEGHERATVLVAVSGPERAADTAVIQRELGSGTVARTQERWADVFSAGALDVGDTVTVLEYDPRETRYPIWWQRVLTRDFPVVLLGP